MSSITFGDEDDAPSVYSNGNYVGRLYSGQVWRNVGTDPLGRNDWRSVPFQAVDNSWGAPLGWNTWFQWKTDQFTGTYYRPGEIVETPPWQQNQTPTPPPPPTENQEAQQDQSPTAGSQGPALEPRPSGPAEVGTMDHLGFPVTPTDLHTPSDQVVNDVAANAIYGVTGAADWFSFGIAQWLRQDAGVDSVHYSSAGYQIGSWGAAAVDVATALPSLVQGGYKVLRYGWKGAKETLPALKIIFSGPKEGIYESVARSTKTYVGQSSNIPMRILRHLATGRLLVSDLATVRTTGVAGGKTAREVAEQLRIIALGGIDVLENARNPIGRNRAYVLPSWARAFLGY